MSKRLSLLLACAALGAGASLSLSTPALAGTGYYSTRLQLGSTFNKRGGGSMELQRNYGSATEPDWKLIKTYSEDEFNALERETNGIADCLSVATTSCAASARNAVQGITTGEATAAQNVITTMRAEGTSLDNGVLSDMLSAGEAGGTLGPELAGTTLGAIGLGPVAFKLGVDIGNGIDQLFGLPTLGENEEETEASAASSSCEVKYEASPTLPGKGAGGEEPVHLGPGKYVECGGSIRLGERPKVLPIGHEHDCDGHYFADPQAEAPGAEWIEATSCDYEKFAGGYEARQEMAFKQVKPECRIEEPTRGRKECIPVGLPAPGLLTPAQEHVNHEHGKEEHPEANSTEASKAPPLVPVEPSEAVTKDIVTGHDLTREKIEEGHPTLTEMASEEAHEREQLELSEVPAPQAGETGEAFKGRLEGLGFTDVVLHTLPEASTDPHVGPSEVAYTSPSAGTRVKPEARLDVEENPTNAPVPPSGGGIGSPTLPGIHLPKLALLCNTMPFGVPCWLVHQLEAFSGTGAPPVWHIHSFKVYGTYKTPEASISLAPLEGIMEIVRPFMVIFGTIGIVLLFYRIFTGHAIGRGENPPGEVPEPDEFGVREQMESEERF